MFELAWRPLGSAGCSPFVHGEPNSTNRVQCLSSLNYSYIAQSMYTINQAAARTGLSVPIIRVWERRYGVVHPSRTPAGYRLYNDESIARLVAMRHLVAVRAGSQARPRSGCSKQGPTSVR